MVRTHLWRKELLTQVTLVSTLGNCLSRELGISLRSVSVALFQENIQNPHHYSHQALKLEGKHPLSEQ